MKSPLLFLGSLMMTTFATAKISAENALTEREQGIVQIAAFAANGNLEKLKTAVDESLDAGLTVNEAGEVFLQLYAYAGFPRSLNAQNVLNAVVQERESKKKKTIFGVPPEKVPSENRYAVGREQINKIFGYNAKQNRPTEMGYATTTDVFLKEHLFSDIIQRNNLKVEERELATVSMLAALFNVNPQLKAHIHGALTIGNSEEKLRGLIQIFAKKVGKKEAKNAEAVLAQVLKEQKETKIPAEEEKPAIPREAQISAFAVGNSNDAYAQYFIGKSYLASLNRDEVSISNVTFEPGCRNNWHIHHQSGQILIVVGGTGWYQEWEKPAQKLRPGDVVHIPPEVKHWHGATKDSWFAHLALSLPGENHTNEWLEEVSDAEYLKLK